MKTSSLLILGIVGALFLGCNSNKLDADASGTFEVDEVIVSAEVAGQIQTFDIREGSIVSKDSIVGNIDPTPLLLQKQQLEATISALREKTVDVEPQVKLLQEQSAILQVQLNNAMHEKERAKRLFEADAATQKQLDDLDIQITILKKQVAVNKQQIKVQESTIGTQNRSILSEIKPLEKSVTQIEDQLKRTYIKNPVNGTVLTKYAMEGEFASPGKALYSIGNLSVITLRVYVTGAQLAHIKLNQPVKVFVDSSDKTYKEYEGVITWISDKAEFTPKTIQTKDERANLVYATKIHVENDGLLKIGMYGEVKFN